MKCSLDVSNLLITHKPKAGHSFNCLQQKNLWSSWAHYPKQVPSGHVVGGFQEAKEERRNPLLSGSHSPEGRQVTGTYPCICSQGPCHFLKANTSKFRLLLSPLHSFTLLFVGGTFMSLTLSSKCLWRLVPLHLHSLLASCGYSNKWLHTWQPKMTEIYSHSPRGQKSEIGISGLKSRFPSRGSGEETIPASPSTWWFLVVSLCSLPLGSHCFFLFCLYQTSLCLPLMRIYVTALRAHPDVPVISFITSANSFVAIKVTFTGSKVPRIRMWRSLGGGWGHYSTNTSCMCNQYEAIHSFYTSWANTTCQLMN